MMSGSIAVGSVSAIGRALKERAGLGATGPFQAPRVRGQPQAGRGVGCLRTALSEYRRDLVHAILRMAQAAHSNA